MKTSVIFRVFQNSNEVIAVFPEVPRDRESGACDSIRNGKHESVHYPDLLHSTRPATIGESLKMQRELEQQGYELLVVQHRSKGMKARHLEQAKQLPASE